MDCIDFLAELVRINSVNPEWGGPGEGDVAKWIKTYLQDAGIEVQEAEVLPGRYNLYAKLAGRDSSRRIVLEAHMDTVSVADMAIPPFEPTLKDGKLYGRGSVDVKAGLAAMIQALVDIRKAGEVPECDVWLAAVIDEEHAYRGVLGLIAALPEEGRTCAAIVAEPTENRVVSANKGVLRFRIETRGIAAHSAKPHLGSNAISAMARVIVAIENDSAGRLSKLSHPLVGSPTCTITTISGGSQVNIVPDRCAIAIDRRLLPGEVADTVVADIRSVLEQQEPAIAFEILPPDLVDEAMETPIDSEIVRVALEALGGSEPVGVPFGCDATKLSRAGIPSIIFGPGSIDQAHTADEYVEVEQVREAAEFYRKVILSFGK